jgi:TonB family protein
MMKPRIYVKALLSIMIFAQAALSCSGAGANIYAQQTTPAAASTDLTAGIELYKRGDDKEAIEVLRRVAKKQDREIAAWYYLALAYTRQGKRDDARKAYERAAKSGEWLIDQLYSTFPGVEVPVDAAKYRALLLLAVESAKKYLEFSPKLSRSETEQWNERTEILSDYVALLTERNNDPNVTRVYKSSELDSKARIISRPEPQYTDKARNSQIEGTVVIRAVFAADGRVRGIRIVKGLPGGLNLMAVRAARRIKFVPAQIGGRPVSQYIQIEYNFNLY